MPLIISKIELKLKWTRYCVLAATGADNVNDNDDDDNIIFTINDIKLYVPVVTFKDQFIGMNIKQKLRTKIRQMSSEIFSNQILLESRYYLF